MGTLISDIIHGKAHWSNGQLGEDYDYIREGHGLQYI